MMITLDGRDEENELALLGPVVERASSISTFLAHSTFGLGGTASTCALRKMKKPSCSEATG